MIMKKMLFTLFALVAAGSAFAQEEYFYMEDFVVPQSVLQGETARDRRMEVPVYAHFDRYVNTWMVDFTLPEGVICKGGDEGPGMIVPYMGSLGDMATVYPSLNISADCHRFLAYISVGGYWYPEGLDPDEDDPEMYGAVKFPLGEYVMFTAVFQFEPDFAGGEIDLYSQPASGADKRGPVSTAPKTHHVCTVTVEPLGLRGDVNDDGSVTPADITALVDYLLGGEPETFSLYGADVNADEVVTPADITSLVDMLLGGFGQ